MSINKQVVILGGNGFLGKNVARNLINGGYSVKVYDIAPPIKTTPGIEYIVGDLWDKESLKDAISGMDTVIHLASNCTPQSSMSNPKNAFIDVELVEELCSVCAANHVLKIIYASSGGTIYGDIGQNKAREDMQTWPINYYAISKISVEKILLMYNKLFGMQNIILRISNPYGWGQSPTSKVGAIAVFTHLIATGGPIKIYGDGNIVRDYIRIEDVAQAFRLVAEWDNESDILPIFNIGSGQGVSISELSLIISKELGKELKVIHKPARNFDIQYNVLDISKAKKHLGYSVPMNVQEGIKRYIGQFYKVN